MLPSPCAPFSAGTPDARANARRSGGDTRTGSDAWCEVAIGVPYARYNPSAKRALAQPHTEGTLGLLAAFVAWTALSLA